MRGGAPRRVSHEVHLYSGSRRSSQFGLRSLRRDYDCGCGHRGVPGGDNSRKPEPSEHQPVPEHNSD
jgi:hypothetical protein